MYASKMYGVCLQYCKDHAEAEDCLQEGFIKVFSKIGEFRFSGSFEGWMRRIMVNTTIESFRKRKPTTSIDDVGEINLNDDDNPHFEEEAGSLNENEIYEVIKELPSKYRMVFNLYVLEGLSHKEIADVLGISKGTSKSNLSRARKWLKDRLTEKMNKKLMLYAK